MKTANVTLALGLVWGALVAPVLAQAQIAPPESTDSGLEELYDKFENEEGERQDRKRDADKARLEKQGVADKEITKLSELSVLAPFEDIAVIQRRFLPKTGRFELSGNALINTNNQYFNNLGAGLRFAFYFQEKYGVEAIYQTYSSSKRPITEGLVDNQHIETRSLVEPESFYGAVFKWTPFYGKMAWFDKKIVPFDFYLTPGFGVTTDAEGGSESTMSLGLGQLFALSKSFGVRWDLTWNFYQPTVIVEGQEESRNQSDIFLGIGLSWFFPEAKYR